MSAEGVSAEQGFKLKSLTVLCRGKPGLVGIRQQPVTTDEQ